MYITNIIKLILFVFIIFIYKVPLCGQSDFLKGQFWTVGLKEYDASSKQTSFESTLGYIPTLSLSRDLSKFSFIDFEWAYRFDRKYSSSSLISKFEKNHRFWIRYSTEKFEGRIGLQKIVFGPSQILRSLSWFDTFNLKDPTEQTDGVESLRLRYYPSNSVSYWGWVIRDKFNNYSVGCRSEISTNIGEWGFTLHHDPSDSLQFIGQTGILINQPNNRVALDFRYDGAIGFWKESNIVLSNKKKVGAYTFGIDYTLPIISGIYLMMEIMHIKNYQTTSKNTYAAFMASVPMGAVNQIMFISQADYNKNHSYNHIRWSTTYDSFSLNLIVSINPKRSDYNFSNMNFSDSQFGFNTGLQLIFIYNH